MTINANVLRAAIARIEERPDQFDMSYWIKSNDECRTTMCLAGHVLAVVGLSTADITELTFDEDPYATPNAAARVLNISLDEADELFTFTSVMAANGRRPTTVDDLKAKIVDMFGVESLYDVEPADVGELAAA